MGLTQVSTDGVKNDAITKTKIPANQIEASELADNAVDTNAIQDDAVTEDKLANAINTSISNKMPLAGGEFTGNVITHNLTPDTDSTRFCGSNGLRWSGVYADNYHGSAANLTNIPAANITGTLPAIDGSNLTGISTTPADGSITQAKLNVPISNRNKIINGAMQISQRNGTSSTNIEGNAVKYHLDRFSIQGASLDELSAGVAQSTDAPDGFAHSMKVTVNTPESAIANNEFVSVYQKMEGQDFQDLAYGGSGAKDITMSFHVKSSITGTFSFTIYRDEPGTDRIINKTYTINSANTWEKKTITITGDTGRSVQNTTGAVWWNIWHLASGSDYDSSVSSVWQNYVTTNWAGDHAQDGVITTNGATWAITGVQLETGSVATEFEHRSFAQELALCQRYFYAMCDGGKVLCENATMYNSSSPFWSVPFPVEMRVAPSLEVSNASGHFIKYSASGATTFNTFGRDGITSTRIGSMNANVSGTGGYSVMIRGNNASSKVHWSAEL